MVSSASAPVLALRGDALHGDRLHGDRLHVVACRGAVLVLFGRVGGVDPVRLLNGVEADGFDLVAHGAAVVAAAALAGETECYEVVHGGGGVGGK